VAVTYAVDIANGALGRLGQPDISTLADTTRDAVVCNKYYTQNRDVCLGYVNWVTATQKVALVRAGKVAISNITKATPPVVTCSGHIYAVGDLVTIEGVVGMTQVNYGMFTVQAVSGSATITLYDVEGSAVAGLGFSSYTSGGYVYRHPGNDWGYLYDLPSDCIRPLALMDKNWGEGGDQGYPWKMERSWVYTNLAYASVKYLKKNTDPTSWDDDMVELMESRLAWVIAPRITSDTSLTAQLGQEFSAAAIRAKMNNSQKERQVTPPSLLWTNAK
jgi:hypothetical protein